MDSKSTGLIAIALIVIVGLGVFFFSFKGKEEMNKALTPSTSNIKTSAIEANYKDGEYKQEGDYTSPGGPEQIDVDITLKAGVITQVNVTSKAENPKSKYMQGIFIANYKQLVIGKNLKDLNLSKVAGSSLTPKGFNDAVEKIKTLAQS